MPISGSSRCAFTAWLQEREAAVADCERQARSALYEHNNEEDYRELMRTKASLLASLADEAALLLNSLSEREKERVQKTLEAFAHSARTALDLNSVFYMSALLYPDDYREGEANNLQKLVASLLP
jgi:hypothetical protein